MDLEKVYFEAYLAEVSYSVVASYAPGTSVDGAVPEGLAGLGKTPQLTYEGRSTCRLFRGVQTDVSIRSRGGDPRCLIKEYAGAGSAGNNNKKSKKRGVRDASAIAARELEAHAMLTAEWNKPGGGGGASSASGVGGFYAKMLSGNKEPPVPPFPQLLGTMTAAMAEVEEQLDEQQWRDNLGGSEPPRPGAQWLVYKWDGTTTVESFAVPQSVRVARGKAAREAAGGGIGLPPAPKRVTADEAARFLLDPREGVLAKCLDALAVVHEAGLAHRSLSGAPSILLTADSQDKGAALERLTPSLLRVKLSNFGFSSRLADGSPERLEALARFTPSSSSSPPSKLALTRFAVAEDLQALGFVFLQLLLGALSSPDEGGSSVTGAAMPSPAVSVRDLERQVEEVLRGEPLREGFRRYAAAEPRWAAAVDVLDADGGSGWDFLQGIVGAREAAAKQIRATKNDVAALSMQTARAQKDHPFLKRWAK